MSVRCLLDRVNGVLCTDMTADRKPIVRDILLYRGILAGGAIVTVLGERFDAYPVLGAHFVSENKSLPDLYAYAVPNLRLFTLNSLVLSPCIMWLCMTHQKLAVHGCVGHKTVAIHLLFLVHIIPDRRWHKVYAASVLVTYNHV